jgi:hypothetical protein
MCVWRCNRLTYAVAGQSRSRLLPVAIAPAGLYRPTSSLTALLWCHVSGACRTALLSTFRPLLLKKLQNLRG